MCGCDFCDEEGEGLCEFCEAHCPRSEINFTDRNFAAVIRWQAHRWKRHIEDLGACPVTYLHAALEGQLLRTIEVSLEARRLDRQFDATFPYTPRPAAAPQAAEERLQPSQGPHPRVPGRGV